jgi:hypothetical protein
MNSQILKTWNDEQVEQKQIKKLAEMFLKVSGYVEPYDCTYWWWYVGLYTSAVFEIQPGRILTRSSGI